MLAAAVVVLAVLPAEAAPGERPTAADSLAAYRAELQAFRREYGGSRNLPDVRFFLFGMGQRAKFLYKGGALLDPVTGNALMRWEGASDLIDPAGYRVELTLAGGKKVAIVEDEEAVWVESGSGRQALDGTRAPVKLPDFAGRRHALVLRVLHQELLVNVTRAGPVPNFFVYDKPWYRDAAMMALAFRETGNLDVIRDWVANLSQPFDFNNQGTSEPDNLGQALFLVGATGGGAGHPLVAKVLAAVKRFEVAAPDGTRSISGSTDSAPHPVYQTKWMKYGLAAMQLPDPYTVPKVKDGYSALFWMDYRDQHVPGGDAHDRGNYPYLGWANDHFQGKKKSPIGNRDYPLTWEQEASEANYARLKVIDPVYASRKLSAPHTWHAAEVFLYVLGADGSARRSPSR